MNKMTKVGLPKFKYRLENSPKWKGGKRATEKRVYEKKRVTKICDECRLPFKGASVRWCYGCRIVICMCGYCLKDFTVKRSEFIEGRGQFCSLSCANKISKIAPIDGINHSCYKHGKTFNQLEYKREIRKNNKERYSFYARRRIYMKKGAEGDHSLEEWEKLKATYQHICLCCKRQEPEIKLTEDHIVPLSRGGSNYIDNIQPLCGSCNSSKYTKTINYIQLYELQ